MKLKCIATGSTGNCYTLTSESGETLILDCGIPIKEITGMWECMSYNYGTESGIVQN